ncbi:hypothetical protein TrVE_jg12507 [Triparma verrucosa]|uniref:Fe2OG dioxygenase domain-containing protein n=1 Tax=Triparma verrucosa TaxID=1606542 RepID=A0A9W7CGF9_9STRA|nr:hypothetical protein TrVE_jg12507 [Triparma verrucosa]
MSQMKKRQMPSVIVLLLITAKAVVVADSTSNSTKFEFMQWQRDIPSNLPLPPSLIYASPVLKFRGGDSGCSPSTATCENPVSADLTSLISRLGPAFKSALDANVRDHDSECASSCEIYYCGNGTAAPDLDYTSYSMGSVPPEDFQNDFKYPLDLIKVTKDETPILTPEQAEKIVKLAEEEGVLNGEYKSGKYKLGGDWLTNLPQTRSLFNSHLSSSIFPSLATLFPNIVSSPSVLRAHSVALLRYNSTHPRTDTHVDNGILAMTLALSGKDDFKGGGTYFEHLGGETVEMEKGGVTFRPGSVRHGGKKVTEGERYILGAFLLIENKVEHVRRLKNRGAEFRGKGELEEAKKYFEWALEINGKCVTCLKDLSEVLLVQDKVEEAERTLRKALELIPDDSDGLFSLGVILSKKGDAQGSIVAYEKSASINSDDYELQYNLGLKYSERGERDKELKCYSNAVDVKNDYGPALLNWGSSLAEAQDYDGAAEKFVRAMADEETTLKAAVNLAMVDNLRANGMAVKGDLGGASDVLEKSIGYLKKAIVEGATRGIVGDDSDFGSYLKTGKGLVGKLTMTLGQVFAGMKKFEAAEEVFRQLTKEFPTEKPGWMGLARILEMRHGEKAREEIEHIKAKLQGL